MANLTYQSGADVDVRGGFMNNGSLANTNDTSFRAINSNWPVFGFAIDLGLVGSKTASTLFSLGLAQQEAIQFDGETGVIPLPSLWTAYFSDDLAAVRISLPVQINGTELISTAFILP